MKLTRLVLLAVLAAMGLGGCRRTPTSDPDNVETWELLPLYGELRFLVVCEDTGAPISRATLRVLHLPIVELGDKRSVRSGRDGQIVVHQMTRGYGYWGAAPPGPTFTFSADHYLTRTYSVSDLVSGTTYDPYRSDGLPTATFEYERVDAPVELPVYEFTIRLAPSD